MGEMVMARDLTARSVMGVTAGAVVSVRVVVMAVLLGCGVRDRLGERQGERRVPVRAERPGGWRSVVPVGALAPADVVATLEHELNGTAGRGDRQGERCLLYTSPSPR